MNKWTLFIFVLVISLVPLPVGAQTIVTQLDEVQVDLWPDLDRPAVLVLVTATLPEGTEYPATVRFALPVDPSAVAYLADDGQMLNAPFETVSDDENVLIEVETVEPTLRIEYYFPYTREDDDVRFTYEWLGGMATDQLVIMFRQPSGATSVNPDARFVDIGILPDGQRYYQWEVGAVGADETIIADMNYVGSLPVSTSVAPAETTDPTGEESNSTLPVILAGAGGLLLGAGLSWALSQQRRTVRRVPQRAKASKAAYCHQCGARLKSGDAFCRQCGTKVR